MKPIFISVMLLTVLHGSCKKDTNTQTTPNTGSFSLVGTWYLIEQSGGFAGMHQTFARGAGNATYTFRGDSTCTRVFSGNTYNSTYSIRPDADVAGANDIYIPNAILLRMSNAHDTLDLQEIGISDGFSYRLVK
ncbi:MAG: hypothetical protein JWQ38_833 [Flavipsychrobacter sp.]|nr:hypothetical protein [Flavipsychrobacter sp.]